MKSKSFICSFVISGSGVSFLLFPYRVKEPLFFREVSISDYLWVTPIANAPCWSGRFAAWLGPWGTAVVYEGLALILANPLAVPDVFYFGLHGLVARLEVTDFLKNALRVLRGSWLDWHRRNLLRRVSLWLRELLLLIRRLRWERLDARLRVLLVLLGLLVL